MFYALEKKENTDFTIAVKKPFSDTGEYMELLNINDSSVVSSGTYERYFYSGDGTFYHHILNPKPDTHMNQSFVMLPSYHMNQQSVTALVQPVLFSVLIKEWS